MKKMYVFFFVCIVLVGSSIVYFSLYGNPLSKYFMVKDTTQYLLEKEYNSVDISSVTSEYHSKRNSEDLKGTVAYVVFKNEPKIKYLYIQWKKSGKIQQHCTYYDIEKKLEEWQSTGKLKHMDSNCTQRDG